MPDPLALGRRSLALLLRLVLCMFVICCAASVHAQTANGPASITGVVLDPDGKVVVNVAVLIRNEATNDLRTTTTDARGRYAIADLRPGRYTIEVAAPGFDIVRRAGVEVT